VDGGETWVDGGTTWLAAGDPPRPGWLDGGMPRYDSFLLVSFGGPEGRDDVLPFLENVTRGRGVPRARLEQVAEHYYRFGGVSPINRHCRDLLAAIEKDFAAGGIDLPVYWGNRNWDPLLTDTVAAMAADGRRHAVAFVTSAYSSYSGCRQYLENIERARAEVGHDAPRIDKLRPYFNHPGFIEPFADAVRAAARTLPLSVQNDYDLVFTAHSIPEAMAAASGPAGNAYPRQFAEASRLVAERVGGAGAWRLAYQSRSGPPSVPWLGPDIGDVLTELAESGSAAVVVVPVGFISDHLEVAYDLDVEAAGLAGRLGLPLARAATPAADPRFVAMITELVAERSSDAPPRALGDLGPPLGTCGSGCCASGAPMRAAHEAAP
jgi:protoporphyrin/coproporphyrin ferrochelatase